METQNKIHIDELCRHYSIENSFVESLADCGLIQLIQADQTLFISDDQLSVIEKYMYFHYDLEINLPGIEAISHLLQRINQLQEQLQQLQSS